LVSKFYVSLELEKKTKITLISKQAIDLKPTGNFQYKVCFILRLISINCNDETDSSLITFFSVEILPKFQKEK